MRQDSNGNCYLQLGFEGGTLRVTYVKEGWAHQPSIRIQMMNENGTPRPGPEIPRSEVPDLLRAITALLVVRADAAAVATGGLPE